MKKETEVEESYQTGPLGAHMDVCDDPQVSPTKAIVIDLSSHRRGELNEGILGMMGAWISDILGAMFQGTSLPVTVKGTRSEIDSFTRTLSREKRYLEMFSKYGLDNPRTYRSKAELNKAVSQFERNTGIKWPFKG